MGDTSALLAAAPALRVLTWPLLVLTLLMLGRGWYLNLSHGERWRSVWNKRAGQVLALSTVVALVLWGLRFGGLLGPSPL